VDGTGSGSCPVAGSGVSGVEPSGSATRELVSEIDLRETGCEDGRWMEKCLKMFIFILLFFVIPFYCSKSCINVYNCM
jgi:hypothetical protein